MDSTMDLPTVKRSETLTQTRWEKQTERHSQKDSGLGTHLEKRKATPKGWRKPKEIKMDWHSDSQRATEKEKHSEIPMETRWPKDSMTARPMGLPMLRLKAKQMERQNQMHWETH